MGVINRVPVRMWVVVGGKERKTMTGLYMEIQKYSAVCVMDLDSISNMQ